MPICVRCGRESPDEFGFCPACGAALGQAATKDVRKVVTVLFCDLTGSTAIGERTDPEALRALMNRYYRTSRAVLERHGGTVEKFVGDAVMAVFGIPVATEEDALRATRAAVEVRDVVHGLGLEARIGVNTGAVVAGAGDTLVTGDAVNVAARLEQAAAMGEILLGDATFRLVRDVATVEPVELSLKGKSGSVAAHRLLTLGHSATGVDRHLDRPMLGRDREQARIRADFSDAAETQTCRLFTLIGPAGVGKSRLVADFLQHVDEAATVAQGRALSYGEGLTYWPLVEMLIQLGLDPSTAILSSPGDTQLATRALLEEIAETRPLVLVLDDAQWAETPMLDLVEHIADWSRDAPIFVLCVGRPELLDVRPGWGGGKLNATSILLEPLAEGDAERLADALLVDLELSDETRTRIIDTAEGNPLFLEEMAALARDARGELHVPPTIQAVLQARLDTLDDAERRVIDRGSVEGKVFHRTAVTALVPEALRDGVGANLLTLVRKELVRPDRAQIAGDDAFRFRHLLIRDTAYESLPKAVRAELHERFAQWFEAHARMIEQDEILGYHLEQAARYLIELDPDDARGAELRLQAADHLGAAAQAALERQDVHGARNLLTRAVELLPAGKHRRLLIPDLVDVLAEAGATEEEAVVLIEELETSGDKLDRAQAVALRPLWDLSGSWPKLMTEVEVARDLLAAAGDLRGAARCERARASIAWGLCQAGKAHAAYRSSRELLRRAGSTAFYGELTAAIQRTAAFSGLPVDEIESLLDDLHVEGDEPGPLRVAAARAARARLAFGAGTIGYDELRLEVDREVVLLRQTGSQTRALWASNYILVAISLTADDKTIEEFLHQRIHELERIGASASQYLGNALGEWALSLCRIGDTETARRAMERGRGLTHADDVSDQIVLDLAEAMVCALTGDAQAARSLLGRARQRAEGIVMVPLTDQLDSEAARIAVILGEKDEARSLLRGLVERYDARGFHRYADRNRKELAALD